MILRIIRQEPIRVEAKPVTQRVEIYAGRLGMVQTMLATRYIPSPSLHANAHFVDKRLVEKAVQISDALKRICLKIGKMDVKKPMTISGVAEGNTSCLAMRGSVCSVALTGGG